MYFDQFFASLHTPARDVYRDVVGPSDALEPVRTDVSGKFAERQGVLLYGGGDNDSRIALLPVRRARARREGGKGASEGEGEGSLLAARRKGEEGVTHVRVEDGPEIMGKPLELRQ